MLLKGCKLRTTDKQKSIYIKPSRKCMLKNGKRRSMMYDFRIYDVGCWMYDVGCWMLDVGCVMCDVGCMMGM